jgi:hypothetical protein
MVEAPVGPVVPAIAGQVDASSPHWDLEQMYHRLEFDQGLIEADRRRQANPDDPVLAWMTARFMFEIGEIKASTMSRKDRVDWYQRMMDMASEALEKHPEDAHLHFGYSVALGRWGTARGVLSSLRIAKELERSMLRTVRDKFAYRSIAGEEHLPCHGYLALSIFYRLVPDSWVVQLLAGTRGSLEKSVKYVERADRCAPGQIPIVKEMGVAKMCKAYTDGDDALMASARADLRRIASLPGEMQTDHIDRIHAKILIEEPERACGYSRDGDQDLDTRTLEMQNNQE